MAARAIWKGAIELDGLQVPVKLYSAVQDRRVHFRLLHDRDLAPVKQVMVDAETEKPVESDDIKKGAAAEAGRFVIVTREDLKAVEPPPSRAIAVERCIARQALDYGFYDRPYWLGPDGQAADYQALVAALDEGQEAICSWVMRNRSYVGALMRRGENLMLITLRQAAEVIAPAEIDVPQGRAADSKELAMARQLVEMLQGGFAPQEYRDEHRVRLHELVERKAKGEKIGLVRPSNKRAPSSLSGALQRSIAALGQRKPSVSRVEPSGRAHERKVHRHGRA